MINVSVAKKSVNVYSSFLLFSLRTSVSTQPKRNLKSISPLALFPVPRSRFYPLTHLGSAKSNQALDKHVFLVQSLLPLILLLSTFIFYQRHVSLHFAQFLIVVVFFFVNEIFLQYFS